MGNTWDTLQSHWDTEYRHWDKIPLQYTSKFKNNADQLVKVINSAELPASIFWNFKECKGKNEFIWIDTLPSEFVSRLSGAEARNYSFTINYYMIISGDNRLKILDVMSRRADKLAKVLTLNQTRNDSGTYYWHGGDVIDIDLDSPLEDFEDEILNLHVSRITYQVTTTEEF